MSEKFRELRMTIICSLLLIFFLGASLYFFIGQSKMQMIGALMLSLIALFLLLFRYKMVLFDDVMVIHEWKVFAMLPTAIEYKDIKNIEIKSKHHIIIEHPKKSHIYVFNAQAFMDTYHKLKSSHDV